MPFFLFFVRLYSKKRANQQWERRRLLRAKEKKEWLLFKQKKEREQKRWAVKKGQDWFPNLSFYEARALRKELNYSAQLWHKKRPHGPYRKVKLD